MTGNRSGTSSTWNVKGFNLSVSNTFYLSLYLPGSDEVEASSAYFNITSRPEDNPPNNRGIRTEAGISVEAKAGIGVGFAVAGLTIIVLAWFVLQNRKSRATPDISPIVNPEGGSKVQEGHGNEESRVVELGHERRESRFTELPVNS